MNKADTKVEVILMGLSGISASDLRQNKNKEMSNRSNNNNKLRASSFSVLGRT